MSLQYYVEMVNHAILWLPMLPATYSIVCLFFSLVAYLFEHLRDIYFISHFHHSILTPEISFLFSSQSVGQRPQADVCQLQCVLTVEVC